MWWSPFVATGGLVLGHPREHPMLVLHNAMLAATLYFEVQRISVIPAGEVTRINVKTPDLSDGLARKLVLQMYTYTVCAGVLFNKVLILIL